MPRTIKILIVIETSLLLHRIVYALDRAADRLLREGVGISHGRAALLRAIAVGGRKNQHELARVLGHTDPAVTAMIKELAAAGMVEDTPDPQNGRRRIVTLTRAGADVVARATAILDAAMTDLVAAAAVDTRVLDVELRKIDTLLNPKGL